MPTQTQQAASAESEEAALLAEQGDRLAAEAAAQKAHSSGAQVPCTEASKYLELARCPKGRWTGNLALPKDLA